MIANYLIYDMKEYFLDSELNKVYVWDFIVFTWWHYIGSEMGLHVQGRIIKDHGHLCFRYKRNGQYSTRRLSDLCFDSTADWLKINDSILNCK